MNAGQEVVIVDAVRTPIGRYKGALKSVRPDNLASIVIQALLDRNPQMDGQDIEEVILGNANGAGEENRNVGRLAALLSGLPQEVGGSTVNRLCGSGLDAVNQAYRGLALGEGDVFIAGGTESMTRAPFVMLKPDTDFPRGNMEMVDTTIGWRFTNKKIHEEYGSASMPQTAQHVADRYGISREEQDEYAARCQTKTAEAMEYGRFKEEIVSVEVMGRKGEKTVVDTDEHPRPGTTVEKLAKLKSLFPDGSVTPGNASGVNDGASALVMMSREKADAYGMKPLARVVSTAVHGVEPDVMGIGPVGASQKALHRAGLTMDDIGVVELNEAFASQVIACQRMLDIPMEKLNVNGGGIALGHPLGASGARILTTLLHEMKRNHQQYGLATMCIGVGQGIATIVERV